MFHLYKCKRMMISQSNIQLNKSHSGIHKTWTIPRDWMLDFRAQVLVTHNQVRTDHIFIRTIMLFSLSYDAIDITDNDNFATALNSSVHITL